jgi:hypothetical protein
MGRFPEIAEQSATDLTILKLGLLGRRLDAEVGRVGCRRRMHYLVARDLLGSHGDVGFALESKRAGPLFTSYPTKESRSERFSLGWL